MADVAWLKLHAVRHGIEAVLVIATLAGIAVQQQAGDICKRDLARVPIFQLLQAASSAAVA
ncbi:hypothetical protein R2A130_1436 [Ahrensia sp. R2A130]|nr:hypothetical protein R2A130_1436 [Ahrensia sp. R2A130]